MTHGTINIKYIKIILFCVPLELRIMKNEGFTAVSGCVSTRPYVEQFVG